MAKKDDEIETSDYKTTKDGKKIRAHRIVFNKGEEDGTKLREESMTDDQKAERERIVKGMKKNYKGFVAKYGKDRAKSVMYATATKAAMKEESEIEEVVAESSDYQSYLDKHSNSKSNKPLMNKTEFNTLQRKKENDKKYKRVNGVIVGRKLAKEEVEVLDEGTVKSSKYSWGTMKHVEHGHSFSIPLHPEHHQAIHKLKDGESHSFTDETKSKWKATREGDKVHFHGASRGNDNYKTTVKHSDLKESTGNIVEAHPFDIPKSGSGMASSTRTNHDVKKTSTGTVYTKQRDADGNSKEFKRDPDEAKRGRGRPKKNSFSEAAEFLMSLTEEQFDDVTSEGFDIFFKSFENINK